MKVGDNVQIVYICPPFSKDSLIGREGTIIEADEVNDQYLVELHETVSASKEEVYCDSENLTSRSIR